MVVGATRHAAGKRNLLPPRLAPGLLVVLLCQVPSANGFEWPTVSPSAFGTLGLAHSSEELADFTDSGIKADGAGYSNTWSPALDSILGAQLVVDLSPKLSATVQLVSEQRYDGSYAPHVEWANIKYQFSPEFSVRVGRTLLSSFLFSDTRKVGYANPWVRPPVEAYGLIPLSSSDGVDVTLKLQIGSLLHTLVASYGQNETTLPLRIGGGASSAKKLWLISDTVEHGSTTLHFTYQQSTADLPGVNVLFDAFRNFGPQGNALADRYDSKNKVVRLITVGAMYDPGKWFVVGEWGNTEFHSVIGNRTGWYATGGYRSGKFTPYATLSEARSNGTAFDPGLDASMLPPALAGFAAALNAGLNATLALAPRQRAIAVGARWDAFQNVSLKLQYERIDLGAGSAGTLTNIQPGFQPGGTVNVISVAMDFVL